MKQLPITIFIHGTLPPTFLYELPIIKQFFFCPLGLTKAQKLKPEYHLAQIARMLNQADPKKFNLSNFYFFGWSGKLSTKARQIAAQKLHSCLKELTDQYFLKFGINPFFQIIAHSHGGNVALWLTKMPNDIVIQELILLACPAQTITESFVDDVRFKKVYSIHSHIDLLQIIDPQGIYRLLALWNDNGFTLNQFERLGPLFSARHFPKFDNLLQIHIKINGKDLMHIEFIMPKFIALLPSLLNKLENHSHEELIKEDIIINLQSNET